QVKRGCNYQNLIEIPDEKKDKYGNVLDYIRDKFKALYEKKLEFAKSNQTNQEITPDE
ncbi:27980_t:CDS:1, partial [Gigaspora margarita]